SWSNAGHGGRPALAGILIIDDGGQHPGGEASWRQGVHLDGQGPMFRPRAGGNAMASERKRVKIAPQGMGPNDLVAHQEGFFAAEGLDVELDWKTFRGTQSSWKDLDYFQRPQDRPYTEGNADVIQGACVWGTICNASAGMGRVVPDAYGDSPWAIF